MVKRLEDMCHYKIIAEDKNDSELMLLKEGMYLPDYYECKYICDGYTDLICYKKGDKKDDKSIQYRRNSN